MIEPIEIPFASKMKNIPITYNPPMTMMIDSHIIIPVQHLTTNKNSKEASIEATAAPTRIIHPCRRSNAQALNIL